MIPLPTRRITQGESVRTAGPGRGAVKAPFSSRALRTLSPPGSERLGRLQVRSERCFYIHCALCFPMDHKLIKQQRGTCVIRLPNNLKHFKSLSETETFHSLWACRRFDSHSSPCQRWIHNLHAERNQILFQCVNRSHMQNNGKPGAPYDTLDR